MQACKRVQKRDQRVRGGAAELATVLRPCRRPHGDGRHRRAAQRNRQRRHTGPKASHVTDHHRVTGEHSGMGGCEGGDRAAHLFLALNHELDPDRRLAALLPAAETDGIATRRARSARSSGMSDPTVSAIRRLTAKASTDG
jgi:hypothetical protein